MARNRSVVASAGAVAPRVTGVPAVVAAEVNDARSAGPPVTGSSARTTVAAFQVNAVADAPLTSAPSTSDPVPDGVMASWGVVIVLELAVAPMGLAAWPVSTTTVSAMPSAAPAPELTAVTAVVVDMFHRPPVRYSKYVPLLGYSATFT